MSEKIKYEILAVSLIMLIMPIVLDFVFMWIHRKVDS